MAYGYASGTENAYLATPFFDREINCGNFSDYISIFLFQIYLNIDLNYLFPPKLKKGTGMELVPLKLRWLFCRHILHYVGFLIFYEVLK